MIIDSHAHLTRRSFDGNFRYLTTNENGYSVEQGMRADVIAACKAHNVIGSIKSAISFESNEGIRDFQSEVPPDK